MFRRLTDAQVASLTLEDARAELSKAVYSACLLIEQLQYANKVTPKAHQMMQAIAATADEMLKGRWNNEEEIALHGRNTVFYIHERFPELRIPDLPIRVGVIPNNFDRWLKTKPLEASKYGGKYVALDAELKVVADGDSVGNVCLKLSDLKVDASRSIEVSVLPVPEGEDIEIVGKPNEFISQLQCALMRGGVVRHITREKGLVKAKIWVPQ